MIAPGSSSGSKSERECVGLLLNCMIKNDTLENFFILCITHIQLCAYLYFPIHILRINTDIIVSIMRNLTSEYECY